MKTLKLKELQDKINEIKRYVGITDNESRPDLYVSLSDLYALDKKKAKKKAINKNNLL